MGDAPESRSRPLVDPNRGGSSAELRGPSSSRAVMSPSEPRLASRASFDVIDAQADRPARIQMIVALFLGLVLVAIPLYLWRRPRAESIPVVVGASDTGVTGIPTAAAAVPEEKLILGEPKTLSCHDPGPKKTPPEQCDHVLELEKALARAIEESSSCVPKDAGGGTMIYVADVQFKKKAVLVSTPKEGRTLRSSKVAGVCERAVKGALSALPYDSLKHDHARYRISVTATYPGAPKP